MILVTGGTGLVGAHLLYTLAKTGHTVRAIYRNEGRIEHTKKVFGYYTDTPFSIFKSIQWVKADILDIPTLENVFKGIEQVYHCAAFISFDPRNTKKLHKVNTIGTANIVNLCIANKVEKICYVSSIATIGNPLDKEAASEKTDFNESLANCYARSKYQAEMEIWRGSQEGVKVIIVNPGIILGPGFWNNGIGTLFQKINKGLQFYPKGRTGFVAVLKVVDAMLYLMNSDLKNERYILVSKNLSYKNAITKIADSLNKKHPKRQLKEWQLAILWRLEWLTSSITGTPRIMSKKMATSLQSSSSYDTTKIEKALGRKLNDLDKTIAFCATIFLEENHLP